MQYPPFDDPDDDAGIDPVALMLALLAFAVAFVATCSYMSGH